MLDFKYVKTSYFEYVRLPYSSWHVEEAKKRQQEAGGDHGNQYTGSKVAIVETLPQPAKPSLWKPCHKLGRKGINPGNTPLESQYLMWLKLTRLTH